MQWASCAGSLLWLAAAAGKSGLHSPFLLFSPSSPPPKQMRHLAATLEWLQHEGSEGEGRGEITGAMWLKHSQTGMNKWADFNSAASFPGKIETMEEGMWSRLVCPLPWGLFSRAWDPVVWEEDRTRMEEDDANKSGLGLCLGGPYIPVCLR